MFRIIKKSKRSTLDVPFFMELNMLSEEYKMHLHKNFIVTKKLLSTTKILSDDKLELSVITEWDSREAFLDFISDEQCVAGMIAPGQIYDSENNITSDTAIDEEA